MAYRAGYAASRQLEAWLRSHRAEELFDDHGRPRDQVLAYVPEGDRRLGASPHANGEEHPHGMPDAEFDALFTRDKPVIFAYHGYPWLIHRLAYRRAGHANLHVRGYKEIGTTTTPFDMVVRNDLDRYRLVMDVIDRVPGVVVPAAPVRQAMEHTRLRHHAWIREHGTDLPEVADWTWTG